MIFITEIRYFSSNIIDRAILCGNPLHSQSTSWSGFISTWEYLISLIKVMVWAKTFLLMCLKLFSTNSFTHAIHSFSGVYFAYKCNECPYLAITEISVASHIYNKHKRPLIEGKDALHIHRCHMCFRDFRQEMALKNHLIVCPLKPNEI